MKRLIAVIMLITTLMLVGAGAGAGGGCQGNGSIGITEADGTKLEVHQPGKAVVPATVSRDAKGNLTISTGSLQESTPALIAADKTWIAWLVGPGLMLLGVGAMVAKKWLPLIPTTAGTYTMAAGVAVMALAIGLPTLPTWLWVAVALGLGAWLIVPGLWANLMAQRQAAA